MDELENELAVIVGKHDMVKVVLALSRICSVLGNKRLTVRKEDEHFPYHGWRALELRLRKAADHASDLRIK